MELDMEQSPSMSRAEAPSTLELEDQEESPEEVTVTVENPQNVNEPSRNPKDEADEGEDSEDGSENENVQSVCDDNGNYDDNVDNDDDVDYVCHGDNENGDADNHDDNDEVDQDQDPDDPDDPATNLNVNLNVNGLQEGSQEGSQLEDFQLDSLDQFLASLPEHIMFCRILGYFQLVSRGFQVQVQVPAESERFQVPVESERVVEAESFGAFAEIVDDWQAGVIDLSGMIIRFRNLFRDKPEIVLGLNDFLPGGYRIYSDLSLELP